MDSMVTVEGIDEVVAWLNTAPKIVAGAAQVRALSAAGNVIADELERRTPVAAENPTDGSNALDRGVLRESVMVEVRLDSKTRGGTAIISHGKNSYVANYLEYGHRLMTHGAKALRRLIKFVPAFPFIRPAAAASQDKAVEVYVETMRDELIKAGVADPDQTNEVAA